MSNRMYSVVDEHVGRHPVARAIAKKRLEQSVRDLQISVRLMDDGEDASSEVWAGMQVLSICLFALSKVGEPDRPEISVMRGAESALVQCQKRGYKWRKADATAVDQGIGYALEFHKILPAQSLTWAWNEMKRIEAQAARNASEKMGRNSAQ
jgi:hypothetical protein